jgi:hypothetical protein
MRFQVLTATSNAMMMEAVSTSETSVNFQWLRKRVEKWATA